MLAASWLLVVLALLPGAGGVPVSASVEFSTPAQGEGNTTVLAGQWALIVFHEPQAASFRFSLPNGTQTNSTNVLVSGWLPAALPTDTTTLGSVDGTVRFDAPWSYLFVRAGSISLTIPRTALGLNVALGSDSVEQELPDAPPHWIFPPVLPSGFQLEEDQAALALRPDSTGLASRMMMRAEGIRDLSWYNATVGCQSAACPEGGGAWESHDVNGMASAEWRSYISLAVPDGTLDGMGDLWGAVVGGHALHVETDGALRFPEARLQGTCGSQACPDPQGKTLLLSGNVTLDGLSASAPNRLRAAMSGSSSATFDETPGWSLTVPQEVGVGLAIVGAAALVKTLLGLFSHPLTPERALDHPRRRKLYAAVCRHPGSTYRFLMEAAHLSDGVTRHHLKALARAGLIVARGHGQAVHYFENHGRYDHTWKPVTALRDPALRQLYDWMAAHPGSQQKDVVEQARLHGRCSPATARKRLLRLEAWGLVATEQKGRRRYYRALPQDPSAIRTDDEAD
jgi:predicted transcriptional regulator